MDVNGGTFASTDATGAGIQIGGGFASASAELLVRAGTVSANTITLGDLNQTNGADVLNLTGGTLYVGSGGIVSGSNAPTYTETIALGTATVGARGTWSSSLPMTLTGTVTFQAADGNNNPYGISLNGALSGSAVLNKTGGGTLTLGATNTYSGLTLINGGTLALGANGTLASLNIMVETNAIFDVSPVTGGFTLKGAQTLKGFGSVAGVVTAASGATIDPGSNALTGTLTFTGGLTENGGANQACILSGDPAGLNNDLIRVSGPLTVSGVNYIQISGSLQSGGVYPLISYAGGTFSGSVTNFTVSGASGSLSNSTVDQIIYFVALGSARAAANVTWLGDGSTTNWDVEVSTNWLNAGTGLPDFFVPGDSALFSDLGATNPLVHLMGTVTPASITVNTASNYTFTGTGSIGGEGSLTVSRGTVTMLTTNSFTGPTLLNGGQWRHSQRPGGGGHGSHQLGLRRRHVELPGRFDVHGSRHDADQRGRHDWGDQWHGFDIVWHADRQWRADQGGQWHPDSAHRQFIHRKHRHRRRRSAAPKYSRDQQRDHHLQQRHAGL